MGLISVWVRRVGRESTVMEVNKHSELFTTLLEMERELFPVCHIITQKHVSIRIYQGDLFDLYVNIFLIQFLCLHFSSLESLD